LSAFILAGIAILIILYMTYPRFLRRRVSAARFFKDLPPPRQGQARLRRGKLEFTLPFFLQLSVLLLLLAALFFLDKKLSGGDSEATGLGVWFIVDTSASMSTIQQGKPRMAEVIKEIEPVIDGAQKVAKNKELCFRLSAMDLERRDLVSNGHGFSIRQAVGNLEPRPLGTDLGILRGVFRLLQDQTRDNDRCRVSHLVVVTDLPAPGWLWESGEIEVVWIDIGQPVDNLGFTGIRAARNPLTGLAAEVSVEVTAYGTAPVGARFSVTAPGGVQLVNEVLNWQQGNSWQGSFIPAGAGQYRLQLSPGGAYAFDDTAIIDIGPGREIRVDWQLPDRQLPRQWGWVEDKTNPYLVVTANKTGLTEVPTLIVGPGYQGYGSRDTEPSVIRDFMETSPLLADVNLDAVESLGLQGIELPARFEPVLRGIDGAVWLAQAENPLRAFVPGLPTGTDDVVGRFSATVFFNAVRWLLRKRDLPPLYTLTSAQEPEPVGSRLVLHPEEGNTQRVPRGSGKLESLKPAMGKGSALPLWPVFLMAAVVIFLLERSLAVWSR
jgi:hypothetical protein